MSGYVLRFVIVTVGLWLAAVLLPGIEIRGGWALLKAALVLEIINAVVRPVVVSLTLPLTILTVGLFLLVINATILGSVAVLIAGFQIAGIWSALLGSIIVSITSGVASLFIGPLDRIDVFIVPPERE